ncbi:disease resistance protein RUN1 isoform X2 [Cryptomeria japonica]|uniref:disease resistance protein RUN1 isoform X2 n=1 Tax=Cryptomeria japonica TaxID=3369 RepID=UPI0027DA1F4C|nr:disease resistance protein RUN1 isoform X2 [Cryptomeria japonica]
MGNACCCSYNETYSASANTDNANDDVIKLSFDDAIQQNDLIFYIDELLKNIVNHDGSESMSGKDVVCSATVSNYFQYSSGLIEKIIADMNKDSDKDFKSTLACVAGKMVIEVMNGAGKLHCVGVGLSLVGHVLKQMDKVCNNRKQCLRLLQYMFALAKHIKQLDEQLEHEKQKLNDILVFIVKGSIMCISQINSSKFSRIFSATVDAEDLQRFESQLGHVYPDLILAALVALLEARPTFLPPSQGTYPDAVGIENARDKVIELLDLNNKSRKAVVVYGVGGIGKTTLATAVYNRILLPGYKICRLNIDQNCGLQDLKLLQQQLLQDLFAKNIKLRDCVEGREKLSEIFKSEANQPVFVFIDNALKGSDLTELFPRDLSCLPIQSRLLITTRKLDETNFILQSDIQRSAYIVDILSSSDARKLVCKKALGNVNASLEKHLSIDKLVECCGGIPLVLEMVGSNLLADGSNVSDWLKFLKETLQNGEGELSESVVSCVYDSLRENSYKEAFLDIAHFFQNWKWAEVGYIIGEVQLKALQDAALVKNSKQGNLTMHDIVGARARWLSKSQRITSVQSLKGVFQDKQKLGQVKGICLSDNEEKIQIAAEDLDLMSESLRVLCLGKSSRVEGRCKASFQNLRFLQVVNNDDSFLPIDGNKYKRLAFFNGNLSTEDNDFELPESVHLMKLKNSFKLPGSLVKLSSLEKLKLLDCSTFRSLPTDFGQLECLRYLTINRCENFMELPESFSNLARLEELKIYWCDMKRLPHKFGQLNCLRHLKLRGCSKLTSLPESFGNLSSLEKLDLGFCSSLVSLPQSFGELEKLKYLSLEECQNLKRLCDNFRCLQSLAAIDVFKCSEIEEEAMYSFVALKSLMFLIIRKSSKLKHRWYLIKERYPLVVYSGNNLGSELREMISTALLHEERRLVHLDEEERLREGPTSSPFPSTELKVAFLLTTCNLSLPCNAKALNVLRQESRRLRDQNYEIIYSYVGAVEQSDEIVRQTLVGLLPGTVALIAPDMKTRQLFGYCAYAGVGEERSALLDECHSFIVGTRMRVNEEGRKCVERLKLIHPKGADHHCFEALTDYTGEGCFKTVLFTPLTLCHMLNSSP